MLVPGTIDVDARDQGMEPFDLSMRTSRSDALLGMPIAEEQARGYLDRLGFDVHPAGSAPRTGRSSSPCRPTATSTSPARST